MDDLRGTASGTSVPTSLSDWCLLSLFNEIEGDNKKEKSLIGHAEQITESGSSACKLDDFVNRKLEANKKPYSLAHHELVLETFRHDLTTQEMREIRLVKNVYYVGEITVKRQNYNDHQGYYIAVRRDHIKFRYNVSQEINRGTFGSVIKAHDCKYYNDVAIKVFREGDEFERFAKHECLILNYIKEHKGHYHDRLVSFFGFFHFRNHFCITFELLGDDLCALLRKNKRGGVPKIVIKTIIRSVLEGLAYLHENNIIHADIKPNNIAFASESGYVCKILDFGLSIFTNEIKDYSVVQTTPYRAPEVFLKAPLGCNIDIFSVGTVTTELAKGCRVFDGYCEQEIVYKYVEVFGFPPKSVLDVAQKAEKFFVKGPEGISMKHLSSGKTYYPNSKTLEDVLLIHNHPKLLDFIGQCYTMDPEKRPTAKQLINHSWLNNAV